MCCWNVATNKWDVCEWKVKVLQFGSQAVLVVNCQVKVKVLGELPMWYP